MDGFSRVIDNFLSTYPLIRTNQGYRRKIMVFDEYLRDLMNLDDGNYTALLRGIDCDGIIESVTYYITKYHISFRITADNYFTVISAFFQYLDENHEIHNANFINITNYNNLKSMVDKTTRALRPSEGKAPIPSDELDNLRRHCETIISTHKTETTDDYLNYCSALILKLTMLVGLKNKEIDKITISDYDTTSNRISINGFSFHLPDTLGTQLKEYMRIRKQIAACSEDSPLFILKNGGSISGKNNEKYWAMEAVLNHKQVERVAKRAVINMITAGIPIDIVINLTGFSSKTCHECIETANEESEYQNQKAKNRILDASLRHMEIYDVL